MDNMTNEQLFTMLKMVLQILESSKDLQEAIEKVKELLKK